MRLELPEAKRYRLKKLIEKFSSMKRCKIRKFAEFTGSIVASCPAIEYGWLYTKSFEREKINALRKNNNNYDMYMDLGEELSADLSWWNKNILIRTKNIQDSLHEKEIYSDASLTGWGAVYEDKRAHGFWSPEEREQHINLLELKAALFGLKCFTATDRDCRILLRIDNTTAISYINKMGGTHFKHLDNAAYEIWRWCEDRNLIVYAAYISSKDNYEADEESRQLEPETEYSLSREAFEMITNKFGRPTIDIFASRANTKCEAYFSWRRDPNSVVQAAPNVEEPFPGGRESIAQGFLNQGIPPSAIETSIASIEKSTLRTYEAPLRKWWNFCQKFTIDFFNPTAEEVIRFLQEEFNNKLSYSALNIARSAISLITSNNIGGDKRITRFFRGIYKMRPAKPKYDNVWDPASILEYFKTQEPNEKLTFQELSEKLVTLLALVTGQRMQTLSLIKVDNITVAEDSIKIFIPDHIKTSKKGVNQPTLLLPFYTEEIKICPASTLKYYLDITKKLRGNIKLLFLSARKFEKQAVSKETLSRWVKKVFKKVGIDQSFSAHSTRHASTSKAKKLGINVDVILRTAGWSSGSCFARFYNKDLIDKKSEFAYSILSNK
ncbi:hypothetical protein TKK_0019005 [Trichogramma kaykai]